MYSNKWQEVLLFYYFILLYIYLFIIIYIHILYITAFSWINKLKLHPCVCLHKTRWSQILPPNLNLHMHTTQPQQQCCAPNFLFLRSHFVLSFAESILACLLFLGRYESSLPDLRMWSHVSNKRTFQKPLKLPVLQHFQPQDHRLSIRQEI